MLDASLTDKNHNDLSGGAGSMKHMELSLEILHGNNYTNNNKRCKSGVNQNFR